MAGMNAPPLLVIDGATAEALVTPEETVALATSALIKTSDGRIAQDIRRTLALPGMAGTCLSVMVAAEGPQAGAKVQSVYPDNFRHGLHSHQGGVLLFASGRRASKWLFERTVEGHGRGSQRDPLGRICNKECDRQRAS